MQQSEFPGYTVLNISMHIVGHFIALSTQICRKVDVMFFTSCITNVKFAPVLFIGNQLVLINIMLFHYLGSSCFEILIYYKTILCALNIFYKILFRVKSLMILSS